MGQYSILSLIAILKVDNNDIVRTCYGYAFVSLAFYFVVMKRQFYVGSALIV